MKANVINKVGWTLITAAILASPALGSTPDAAGQHAVGKNSHALSDTNQIRLSITTNYYRFGGTNHAQMRVAMLKARPWKNSEAYDALTKWDVSANYLLRPENGQFRVDSVRVRAKVVITLPFWIPGRPVPRELVNRWTKCLIGLSTHEQGHRLLAEAAGREVEKRLLALPAFPSARELGAAAHQTVSETLEEFRERERKYDKVTRHGFTQGAVFPRDPAQARH